MLEAVRSAAARDLPRPRATSHELAAPGGAPALPWARDRELERERERARARLQAARAGDGSHKQRAAPKSKKK